MSAYQILAKILGTLFQPGNLLLILLLVGAVGGTLGRGRWTRPILWFGVLGLMACAVFPGGGLALSVLENRFEHKTPPETVDGIIVLGGSVQTGTSAARGQPALNDNAERDIAFMALARRYPNAKLVFAGGTGTLAAAPTTEAAVARDIYVSLGIDPNRLMLEDKSRNTWENAAFSRDLVGPKPGEIWLLVTSARHMPRAVGAFRKAGWSVVPYPVDYRTSGRVSVDLGFNLGVGLRGIDEAAHEWIGLAVYYALGRSTALFPGEQE